MNKELIEKLLITTNRDEFREILIEDFPDWRKKRELWDEEVIRHCIKIFKFSREQFENQFKNNFIPIDDFEEEI